MTGKHAASGLRAAVLRFLFEEEHQYAPFIGASFFFALIIGFPLGLVLAHAAAQGSDLGGWFARLVQVHGHVQLVGWFGPFVMGMGYRLVARFTAVKHRFAWVAPATLGLVAAGLVLRAIGQTFADDRAFAVAFGASGVLELLGAALFAGVVLRSLRLGRPDEFGYKPFFAAGAAWLTTALLLNSYLVLDAAFASQTTVPAGRSAVVAFLLLFGFVSMFVQAVSVRTFPVFFGRQRANRTAVTVAWGALCAGIALHAGSALWGTYERSDLPRDAQSAGLLLVSAGFLLMIGALGILNGAPVRLREPARRNMRFVRSGYAWLTLAAALQAYFAASALVSGRPVHAFQVDAVRHIVALGYLTTVTIGMAFLVMPAIAMRRLTRRSVGVVAMVLLPLLHGAAAARGLGSLIADEGHLDAGYWTMSIGGTLGLLAMAIFVGYVLWRPAQPVGEEIALAERR